MSRLRLFKSSSYYPAYIAQLYRTRPELREMGYELQLATVLGDYAAYGDAWSYYLQRTGRYEVFESAYQIEELQRRWALEHGGWEPGADWTLSILEEQMRAFRPDVWFSHGMVPSEFRMRIRRRIPSIRLVIGYDGFLGHDPERYRGCDLILTCVNRTAQFYRSHGFDAVFWPHGFDVRILNLLRPGPRRQVSFSGSVMMQGGYHSRRARTLARLTGRFDLYAALNLVPSDGSGYARALGRALGRGRLGEAFGLARDWTVWNRLREAARPAVFGLEMYSLLADSAVTLNFHTDVAGAAANMRLFEATGIGSCLLTDWKENLCDFFEPDREIVTFKTDAECMAKVGELCADERSRGEIARAGQQRCLREHSIEWRMDEIEKVIVAYLGGL
jgi:spore maturation protein CgeB